MKTPQQTMTEYLSALLDGLVTTGSTRAVISPGSRSTPVSLLIHRDPRLTDYVAVDERSAAFFALGLAKASQEPVILVCTSGTAAANYYPAICEAKASRVPLVILTTDRPPELQGVGAPQTMNQQELFGKQVKSFTQLTAPEETPALLRSNYWQGEQAARQAKQAPKGPVHLNIPLREPLLPDLSRSSYPANVSVDDKVAVHISLASYTALFEKKGIIVVGEAQTPAEARMLLQVAETLHWPIVGDPLTNLATCGYKSTSYIRQIDSIFGACPAISELEPEVVLRFGRLPISKNLAQWLSKASLTPAVWLLVDDGQEWLDQLQCTTHPLPYSTKQVCQAILEMVVQPCALDWLEQWQTLQKQAEEVIAQGAWLHQLSETSAAYHLFAPLPEQTQVMVANSNAIRMVDRFLVPTQKECTIWGNRGVNGIDGTLSTAAGIAAATQQPTVLLVGDLALFHDMNGLQLIRAYQLPVTIVLMNNQGGGIFSFLSQRTLDPTDFDPLFATSLAMDFGQVATLYQMTYLQPQTLNTYQEQLSHAIQNGQPALIEIQGTFDEPVAIWNETLTRLRKKVESGE